MCNRLSRALPVVLAFAMTAMIAADATAASRKHSKEVKALLQTPQFSDCGEFSGAIGGEIMLHGTRYRLADNATIYQIGGGLVPQGTVFDLRMVTVLGTVRGNSKIVHSVLVRPPAAGYSAGRDLKASEQAEGTERPK